MAKRARGEGGGPYYVPSEGRWRAFVSLPGQYRRVTVSAPTEAECLAKKQSLIQKLAQGQDPTPQHRTVDEFMAEWLTDIRPEREPSTWRGYESKARLHLLPGIGGIRLADLRPPHIRALYNERRAAGLSDRSVKHVHEILHAALETARQWGYIAANPADAMKAPRVRQTYEPRTLTLAELLAVADATKHDRLGALFFLAMTTGMRQSELLGLRWGDLDLDRGILFVRRKSHRVRGLGLVTGPPKSRRSRRPVVLPLVTRDVLLRHRQAQASEDVQPPADGVDLVFRSTRGGPLTGENVTGRDLPRLLRLAGVSPADGDGRNLTFHGLRHSMSTLLVTEKRLPLEFVGRVLGHADDETTRLYTHGTERMQADVALAMDELLGNNDENNGQAGGRFPALSR